MKRVNQELRDSIILAGLALVSCLAYLGYSTLESGLGFPLDDAWIHHTFARNLALRGEWSFIPGEPSGASTGPLWGAMLAVIYLLKIDPLWGNYLVGFLIVWFLGLAGLKISRKLLPEQELAPLLIGCIMTFEWHLIWAALSGMETMLLGLFSLLIFLWLLDGKDNWWLPGLLIGTTIWVRPDGLTLVGPVLVSLLFRKDSFKKLVRSGLLLVGAILILVIPYLLFNLRISGEIWPNTFYAKQAEYAFLYSQPLISRFARMGFQIFVGVGIALLPGMVWEIRDMVTVRDWARIGFLLWVVGYIGIYSWKLPVAYQHGRYIMPVLPIFFTLGAVGMARALRWRAEDFFPRVFSKAWVGTAFGILVVFWVLGARSYALDVGVINTEMVDGALWIEQNTPRNSIIAAHDVGALGYFSGRQIRDLAGLVKPDVIPFMRDDQKLAGFLDREGVDYLFAFRDWYPGLIEGRVPVYTTEGHYAPLFGMENFAVYEWR